MAARPGVMAGRASWWLCLAGSAGLALGAGAAEPGAEAMVWLQKIQHAAQNGDVRAAHGRAGAILAQHRVEHGAVGRGPTGCSQPLRQRRHVGTDRHLGHGNTGRRGALHLQLLRTAVAEMLGFPNTPAAIIINESLDIARRYAAPESVPFLNGVLDAIARDLLKKRLA